jgi:hypothetical protein
MIVTDLDGTLLCEAKTVSGRTQTALRYLREKGIIAALEEKGVQEGDTVRLYYMEFDFWA